MINFIFLTESRPSRTVDSGPTYHIVGERGAFVEYRRINQGTKWYTWVTTQGLRQKELALAS